MNKINKSMINNLNAWYKKILEAIFPLDWRVKFYRVLRGGNYPYIYTFSDLGGHLCSFEISGPVEEFRVKKMGGEIDYTQKILREIQSDDVFFDIGSCVGLITIPALLIGAEVICFEPDPGIRKRLKRNLELNNVLGEAKLVDWAVSNNEGIIDLYTEGINGLSPSLVRTEKRNSIKVPSNTIDNAIKSGRFPNPSIIKMDIEGAEAMALKGMIHVLNANRKPKLLFIELHPENLRSLGSNVNECINLIESSGYQISYKVERYQQIHTIFKKKPC